MTSLGFGSVSSANRSIIDSLELVQFSSIEFDERVRCLGMYRSALVFRLDLVQQKSVVFARALPPIDRDGDRPNK